MREKEQELNKKEALKKAYIGNAIMLFVLAVAIILAVFAWFVSRNSIAKMSGINYVTKDNRDIRFFTQAGTLNSDGSLTFSGVNLNSSDLIIGSGMVIPGQKRYYKTTIENHESSAFIGALTLQDMLVNKRLSSIKTDQDYTALNFGALAKYNAGLNASLYSTYNLDSFKDHVYYLNSPQQYVHLDGTVDTDWDMVSIQYICSDIYLPKQVGSTPGRFEIIWEFEVDGESIRNSADATNMMGEALLQFQHMIFVVDKTVIDE